MQLSAPRRVAANKLAAPGYFRIRKFASRISSSTCRFQSWTLPRSLPVASQSPLPANAMPVTEAARSADRDRRGGRAVRADVPQTHRVVGAGRRQPAVVTAQGHRLHGTRLSLEHDARLVLRRAP